jgi:hypothetical protein
MKKLTQLYQTAYDENIEVVDVRLTDTKKQPPL